MSKLKGNLQMRYVPEGYNDKYVLMGFSVVLALLLFATWTVIGLSYLFPGQPQEKIVYRDNEKIVFRDVEPVKPRKLEKIVGIKGVE